MPDMQMVDSPLPQQTDSTLEQLPPTGTQPQTPEGSQLSLQQSKCLVQGRPSGWQAQTPSVHDAFGAAQTMPQPPQLLLSIDGSTQPIPGHASAGQPRHEPFTHDPEQHSVSLAHVLPSALHADAHEQLSKSSDWPCGQSGTQRVPH